MQIYFSVPEHTPVVLSEVGDCGTTMMRFLCGDAGGAHENRQLNNFCPQWIMDITCQVLCPSMHTHSCMHSHILSDYSVHNFHVCRRNSQMSSRLTFLLESMSQERKQPRQGKWDTITDSVLYCCVFWDCFTYLHFSISNNDRLSAQDLLTIRKVHDYAYNKLYGEEGRLDENGERLEPETCLEILCMDQVWTVMKAGNGPRDIYIFNIVSRCWTKI